MGAYEKLVAEGKGACRALESSTPWSRHSWARSVRTLERAGLFPAIGLEQVLAITARTGLDPEATADVLVLEAAKVRGQVEPVPRAVHERAEVCPVVFASPSYDPVIGPGPHVCSCARLEGHAPSHLCRVCKGIW